MMQSGLKITNNQFVLFVTNVLVLLFIVLVMDRLVGSILRHFYFSQTSGAAYRTTYSMDSTKADIIVFGSSRANHHYVPEVFEDNLNLTFYNTGRDGNFIFYNFAVFKAIIKRHNPKIVIFDVNPNELIYSMEAYDRLSSLLPYYNDHNEIRDIIELRSPYEKLKLLSAIYPFNSNLFSIGAGNLKFNKSRNRDRKGYIPLYGHTRDSVSYSLNSNNYRIDMEKVRVVEDIAYKCKENDIELLFIVSPMFVRPSQTVSDSIFRTKAGVFKAHYLNFICDSVFESNPRFFVDRNHLNDEGATKFSQKVADYIKRVKSNYYMQL